ncbi:Unknown protein, partial [Striga hermonthica]
KLLLVGCSRPLARALASFPSPTGSLSILINELLQMACFYQPFNLVFEVPAVVGVVPIILVESTIQIAFGLRRSILSRSRPPDNVVADLLLYYLQYSCLWSRQGGVLIRPSPSQPPLSHHSWGSLPLYPGGPLDLGKTRGGVPPPSGATLKPSSPIFAPAPPPQLVATNYPAGPALFPVTDTPDGQVTGSHHLWPVQFGSLSTQSLIPPSVSSNPTAAEIPQLTETLHTLDSPSTQNLGQLNGPISTIHNAKPTLNGLLPRITSDPICRSASIFPQLTETLPTQDFPSAKKLGHLNGPLPTIHNAKPTLNHPTDPSFSHAKPNPQSGPIDIPSTQLTENPSSTHATLTGDFPSGAGSGTGHLQTDGMPLSTALTAPLPGTSETDRAPFYAESGRTTSAN